MSPDASYPFPPPPLSLRCSCGASVLRAAAAATSFGSVWRAILECLGLAMAGCAGKSELLAEAIPEALKNMLMVLQTRVRKCERREGMYVVGREGPLPFNLLGYISCTHPMWDFLRMEVLSVSFFPPTMVFTPPGGAHTFFIHNQGNLKEGAGGTVTGWI